MSLAPFGEFLGKSTPEIAFKVINPLDVNKIVFKSSAEDRVLPSLTRLLSKQFDNFYQR